MAVIPELLTQLFPKGTGKGETSIAVVPPWPTDLFACCAAILNLTGRYWEIFENEDESQITRIAESYGRFKLFTSGRSSFAPMHIEYMQKLWNKLTLNRANDFASVGQSAISAAVKLLLIADRACIEVRVRGSRKPFAQLLQRKHMRTQATRDGRMPKPFETLCWQVPMDRGRVLPKLLVPKVGQTVNNLSKNIAYIPSNEVLPRWFFARNDLAPFGSLNALLVPFPYSIANHCFQPSVSTNRVLPHFVVEANWMAEIGGVQALESLIGDLLSECKDRSITVNCIVLPELALKTSDASELAKRLAIRCNELTMLVCGVGGTRTCNHKSTGVNECNVFFLDHRGIRMHWAQSKHHQWKLTPGQIERYQLEEQLSTSGPECFEDFEIDRKCLLFSLNDEFIVTTLICEDIARSTPVLPVIEALGPSLVIALLMDDAQLPIRWNAKKAESIWEAAGTSVLTFTSLGMVARSTFVDRANDAPIAYWQGGIRGSTDISRCISMPWDAQGVVICVEENVDNPGGSVRLADAPIPIRAKCPPSWSLSRPDIR